MKRKTNPFKSHKYEILYNVINSLLAGALVLLGSFTSGDVTHKSLALAFISSAVVFITKIKEYWEEEKKHFSQIFNFVKI